MVTQPYWSHALYHVFTLLILKLDIIICLRLLMECFHWLVIICVYFYGSIVNFAHGLYLDVVAPLAMRLFFRYIVIEIALDKIVEVRALRLNVLHAFNAHQSVLILIAVCLQRYGPEKAVAVVADLNYLFANGEHIVLKFIFLGFATGSFLFNCQAILVSLFIIIILILVIFFLLDNQVHFRLAIGIVFRQQVHLLLSNLAIFRLLILFLILRTFVLLFTFLL